MKKNWQETVEKELMKRKNNEEVEETICKKKTKVPLISYINNFFIQKIGLCGYRGQRGQRNKKRKNHKWHRWTGIFFIKFKIITILKMKEIKVVPEKSKIYEDSEKLDL